MIEDADMVRAERDALDKAYASAKVEREGEVGRCSKCRSPLHRCLFCSESAQCGEATCVKHTPEL